MSLAAQQLGIKTPDPCSTERQGLCAAEGGIPVPGKGVALGAMMLLRNLFAAPNKSAIANWLAVSIVRKENVE